MTKKDWLIWILLILIAMSVIVNVFAFRSMTFVAGKYGEKCYVKGFEHKGIAKKVYFDTLSECKSYVK